MPNSINFLLPFKITSSEMPKKGSFLTVSSNSIVIFKLTIGKSFSQPQIGINNI